MAPARVRAPRSRWSPTWPPKVWRLPRPGCLLPRLRWRSALSRPGWPRRRTLLLALVLALWPLPLDRDRDRIPVPGPARSAAGPGPGLAGTDAPPLAVLLQSHPPDETAAAQTLDKPVAARPGRIFPADSAPGAPVRSGVPHGADLPVGTGPLARDGFPPGTGRPGDAPVKPADGGGDQAPASTTASTTTATAKPAQCLADDERRLVFVIDVSVSMGLPYGTEPQLENALDEAMHRSDSGALARYRALLAAAGDASRLDLARTAFAQALDETPDGVDVGVVSFHGCRDVRRLEPVGRGGFPGLLAAMDLLAWHRGGETALSEALREAYAMAGEGAARIAVITDGKDTCGPPPCSVIGALQRRQPGIRVDVVDVSGRSDAACLALATGGTFQVAPLSAAVGTFVSSVRSLGRACPAPR